MPSTTRPRRIGMIVPSSNTCLKPQTYRILGGRTDVTIHFTRIPVTRTLEYLEAFRTFGTERIALFTPYTEDVNHQVIASYEREGTKTVDHQGLRLSDNESFVDPRRAGCCVGDPTSAGSGRTGPLS